MKKKILVADNDHLILKFMTDLLGKEGHQVKTAKDGLAALDILITYIPDVMFVDLVMPNINGEQLCRIIRKMPELKDTYIVILSATVAEKSRDSSELGANAFIAKASLDQMAELVLAAIEQSDKNIPGDAPEKIMGLKSVYKRGITRELLFAEGHLETILRNISDAIIELTSDARIIFANPAAVSLMGLPEEKLLGASFTELINADDRLRIEKFLKRLDEGLGKTDLDTPVIINSRQVSLSMFPVRDDAGLSTLLILHDTTEAMRARAILERDHKELEQLVKERTIELAKTNKKLQEEIHNRTSAAKIMKVSEEKYRSLFEESRDSIVITTVRGEFIDANTAALELFGYKKEEILKMNFGKLYVDPDGGYKFQKEIKKRGSVENFETRLRGKGGVEMDCIFDVVGRRDDNGNILEYRGIIRDISNAKRAQEALRESEERFRIAGKASYDLIYEWDVASNALEWFGDVDKLLGYRKGEISRDINAWLDLINPEDRVKLENAVELHKTSTASIQYEYRVRHKDGTYRHWNDHGLPLLDDKGCPYKWVGVCTDITEQKTLENQLQQARKMEAIGNLAGGIAHEFNNALMGIMGNIELLKMDLPENERRDKYFEAMKGSGYRMSRLTDQLLAYAQGGKYQPKNLKLDGFMIQTLPILQHDLNSAVRVETHFEKVSYIEADYTQMQMLLSAILANSNEAIEDEGLIRITAANRDVDEGFARRHPGLKPGPYACLTIEDDGKGMDEETRKGIFDPFFTTKFQGRGMGMAAVYGIVKNHDGWISVDSELGKGTTVQIYLPAISAEGKEQRAKAATQPDIKPGSGKGTILMIEDEDVVIEVTQTMLEMLGYRVMVAKNGKDAVHITKTFDGQIDLALLDIKLPDMDGGKVYPLIMEARPDLKVIVFSGFAIEGPARKILDAGAEDFIQKPFSLAILSKKLEKVLGRK